MRSTAKILAIALLIALAAMLSGIVITAWSTLRQQARPRRSARIASASGRVVAKPKRRRPTASAGQAMAPAASKTPNRHATPSASLEQLRRSINSRDGQAFQEYVDEDAVLESFLRKVDKDGLKGPNGRLIVRPGLGVATRILLSRIALMTLRRALRGQAVARGVGADDVDRAMGAMKVAKIEQRGRFARVTLVGGPLKRAVLGMRRSGSRWRVVEIRDFGAS